MQFFLKSSFYLFGGGFPRPSALAFLSRVHDSKVPWGTRESGKLSLSPWFSGFGWMMKWKPFLARQTSSTALKSLSPPKVQLTLNGFQFSREQFPLSLSHSCATEHSYSFLGRNLDGSTVIMKVEFLCCQPRNSPRNWIFRSLLQLICCQIRWFSSPGIFYTLYSHRLSQINSEKYFCLAPSVVFADKKMKALSTRLFFVCTVQLALGSLSTAHFQCHLPSLRLLN